MREPSGRLSCGRGLARGQGRAKGQFTLHITNGDSAGDILKQTGLPGTVLPWRDILHEGPTPAGLTLEQLSPLRAQFSVDQGWGGRFGEVLADFRARDTALADFRAHEEVALWFEHDLDDQLQLCQLFDWFAGKDLGATRLSLIGIGAFPGIDNFMGLGQLSVAQMRSLFDTRHPVTRAELDLGRAAWQAFCAPEPTALQSLLAQDTATLPCLAPALRRHLEQFPALDNGLARAERQALESIAAGYQRPVEIFLADQRKESRFFPGDAAFWEYLHRLSTGRTPLLQVAAGGPLALPWALPNYETFLAQEVALTEPGRAVLAGQADQVRLNGINRWLGGVHLQGPDAAWRWDRQNGVLVETRA